VGHLFLPTSTRSNTSHIEKEIAAFIFVWYAPKLKFWSETETSGYTWPKNQKPKINKCIINQVLNLTYLIINTQKAETELNCVKLHIRPFFYIMYKK